jgi:hypothetical protein
MRPMRWQRSPGASLLAEHDGQFDADTCRGHTLEAIRAVLEAVKGPPGRYESWGAFDVFAGYLALDGWIANTDRHAHNWAVLQAPDGAVHLAPSFDHGSALGSGDGEERRVRAISPGQIHTWCERGIAYRFETAQPITLVELAAQALQLAGPTARRHWTEQISRVNELACENIVARVPNLSDPTRTFICEVLEINRRRLRDVS